jgi:hypothetical protein
MYFMCDDYVMIFLVNKYGRDNLLNYREKDLDQ